MKENLDRSLWSSNTLFCGVDEVGRGALAGPVVAAAVVLRPGTRIPGADDSKALTPLQRARLDATIRERALALSLASVSPAYIDRHNVSAATFHAMRRAVAGLSVRPELALADGWAIPGMDVPSEGIVRGDSRSLSIACASIVAKVFRDRLMERLDRRFPGYGMGRHKGYGTAEHLSAITRLGPSPIHRRSFAPVRSPRIEFSS